jgi:hypothetical protein
MYSLSVIVGPVVWSFMFKTEEAAHKVVKQLIIIKDNPTGRSRSGFMDDFGQEACLEQNEIKGWMLEDLDQSKLAHIERALFNSLVHNEALKRAQSDPRFRAPSVVTPMLQPGFSR